MKHLFSRLSPAQKIILSFLLVIFCNSLLLSLPSGAGSWIPKQLSGSSFYCCLDGLCDRAFLLDRSLDAYNV